MSGQTKIGTFKKIGMTKFINLQRFDLASIRLVVLCAESGSLSEAARRCHLSLSGASHRLKAFEDAVGEPVFQRHRRGLRITIRGRHVVYCGMQLLNWVDRLAGPALFDGEMPELILNGVSEAAKVPLPLLGVSPGFPRFESWPPRVVSPN